MQEQSEKKCGRMLGSGQLQQYSCIPKSPMDAYNMEQQVKKLKLGVLGLGEGRSIISAALNSDAWQVGQICDVNEELCRQMQRYFELPGYTTDYGAMLADPEIDAIGIYTPDHLHAQHIVMALEAGKHVICTKPLVIDLSEGRKILNASKKSGLKVFVGQSSRFFEPMKHQRLAYEQGKLGEICTVEAYYNADHRWFLEKQWTHSDKFKWLFGGLSHPADLIRWYMPDIEEVMAYGDISSNGKAFDLQNFDIMHIITKTKSGKIGRVSGTYSCPLPPEQRDSGMSCILRCENGASQADYHELRYSEQLAGEAPVITHYNEESYYFRFGGKHHHAGEYQNYIEYFSQCLEDGQSPLPDIEEGLITVAFMLAAERSMIQNTPIKVRDILKENGLEDIF